MIVVAHSDDELYEIGANMNRLIQEENILTHVIILEEGTLYLKKSMVFRAPMFTNQ